MDNSLILAHLPARYLDNQAFITGLRSYDEAPPAGQVAELLCSKGVERRKAWTDTHEACRQAEVTAKLLSGLGIHAVDYWHSYYPSKLRFIREPPWVLFFKGNLPVADTTLAIVGSRMPNTYGREVLTSIIPQLQTRPLQIVSGLAYGVDGIAHQQACAVGIPNFAVLGCGLDMLYPSGHEQLADAIIRQGGGLLSEFAPGTQPLKSHFPRRNRIISGVSDLVWIVQGTWKSGSLHTAKHALDQGKQVAATPGDIFSELSQLPNRLLRDGADPITEVADLDGLLSRRGATLAH